MQNFIQKNNKIFVVVFRVSIFLALITGVMYISNFFAISKAKDPTDAINSFCVFYYAYLVFTLVGVVFSIICFKSTSTVASVVRTVTLAVTAIILFMNNSMISLLREALKAVESDSVKKMERVTEKMYNMANDMSAMGVALLSLATVFLMFILAITSIVALIKVLKSKDAPADVA